SVSSAGGQGTGESRHPTLSSDGRFVAFWSLAPNLVAGDTNGTYDIFVHDRDTDSDGIFDEPGEVATTLVSTSSGGRQGNHSSDDSAISADGRFLAFWSLATNLVPGDTNDTWDVFVHDRLAAPQGPFCAGFLATIVGTGGDDLLTGTAGVDVIKGLGGDDTIDGLEGADVICADRGNDTVAGGPGVDLILGGPGNDQLFGQDDIDLIWGNAGDDAMDGGSDLDACNGGPNVAGDTALNCEFTFGVP
ncbi:MAG TPA: hypothetical protein VFT91_10435, partial [Dehalococcoidia bacterium]|nr:hypothetical protein [Dehalococcoidia bacterium]